MNKRLIAIATLAALPAMSFAADGASVSGFADIIYTADNDTSVFSATAEINIVNKLSDKVTVRVDTDLALAVNGGGSASSITGGPSDSATIEQAFFAFTATKTVTVIGGVFNNPMGLEKEDAPDMPAISKGQIWGILDGQTALAGNNVAGVAVAAGVGPATITVGVLNDIGLNDTEKNSFVLVANVTPVKGLDLEVGYVTQEAGPGTYTGIASAENVMDFNAAYSVAGATLTFDYLSADAVVDSAMEFGLGYAVTSKANAYVRYDTVAYEAGGDDDTTTTLYGSYQLAKNLLVAAEYNVFAAGDGVDDDAKFQLEFIATF